ncbi:MAG: 2-oxoacid:acceptor oxidoreductase family protein [Fusobacteria bacterium]|nr:2-oxoacid:acceptor oxidoreductase family protein [Fusobacteriota bacterium]
MTSQALIIAGFGGQGVLTVGKLLAYAGMVAGKEVSWMPSYGPEMRGGTSNCHIMISDELIGSPVVAPHEATSVIAMNGPSLDKFEDWVAPGGHLFINSSIIERKPKRSDIHIHYIDANELAKEAGTMKAANMVMLGSYLAISKVLMEKQILDVFTKVFGEDKAKLIPLNEKALNSGKCAIENR